MLTIGHVLFAMPTALWTAILVVFPLVLTRLASESFVQGATPAAGLWVAAMLLGLPVFVPLTASLVAAYGFASGRGWAPRLAATLSITCLVAIANGLFWTVIFTRRHQYFADRVLPPMLGVAGIVAVPWCLYVLAHTSARTARVWGWRPLRRPLILLAAAAVVIPAWCVPVHIRSERRDQLDVLWSADRAFVCASRRTSAGVVTPAGVLRTAIGYSPLRASRERQRGDLVVVEITGSGFRRTAIDNFPARHPMPRFADFHGGRCFVHEGLLHYQERAGDPSDTWRWHDGRFDKLSTAETAAVHSGYPSGFRPDEYDGWKLDPFSQPGHSLTLDLGGTRAVIRAAGDTHEGGRQRFTGSERVLLQQEGGSEVPVLVVERDPVWISRADYRALHGPR